MYAEKISLRPQLPISYQCQNCDRHFRARDNARRCPHCGSTDRSNLVVLYLEEDSERAEWLELVDFSAGD